MLPSSRPRMATMAEEWRGQASQFGLKSVVYMPKGSAVARLENIRAEGAEASITELNYDDTVRLASQHAEEKWLDLDSRYGLGRVRKNSDLDYAGLWDNNQ